MGDDASVAVSHEADRAPLLKADKEAIPENVGAVVSVEQAPLEY
jgi:hypothetical protein